MISSYHGKTDKYSFENQGDWINDLKVIRANYYWKGKKGRLGMSMKSQWKLLNESEFEMKTEKS